MTESLITLSHSNSKDDNTFTTPFKSTNYGIHPTCASSISEWINRKQNISEKKTVHPENKTLQSDGDRRINSLFTWRTSIPLINKSND